MPESFTGSAPQPGLSGRKSLAPENSACGYAGSEPEAQIRAVEFH
jgi:hypothetical protein